MAKNSANVARVLKPDGSYRTDSWENAVSGLGTLRDKSRHTKFKPGNLLRPELAEYLFAQDDLARTIVTAIVDDGLREGFSLRPADEETGEEDQKRGQELVQELSKLEALKKLRLSALWGRCYGRGAVLLVVANAGPADKPLEAGQGELLDLVDLDRRELTPQTWYQDPLAKNFGQPETYLITPVAQGAASAKSVIVHETRLILFGGVDTPKRVRAHNEGCDLSVLQCVYDVLRGTNSNWDSVCAMLADMSQAVIKLRGLIDAVAGGKAADLEKRIGLMDTMRSAVRAIVLDADGEEFEYTERGALTGIEGLIDKTWSRLAAAAGMPVTRLFGVSPAGMNATGESDTNFWYDRVRAWQRDVMGPAILRLVSMLDSGEWEVVWPELEKMNPKEEAELRQAVATTDKLYIDAMILLPEEIFKARFGSGQWKPGYDGFDLETREKALAKELAKMEQDAGKDEPPPVIGAPGAGGLPGGPPGTPPQAKPAAEPEAEDPPAANRA
jgi:phage-related protein (TIGR01555 family)